MKLSLPKIESEQQYQQYKATRETIGRMSSVYIQDHTKEINELNMRIIQWNCRNDDHNPVQVFEEPSLLKPIKICK